MGTCATHEAAQGDARADATDVPEGASSDSSQGHDGSGCSQSPNPLRIQHGEVSLVVTKLESSPSRGKETAESSLHDSFQPIGGGLSFSASTERRKVATLTVAASSLAAPSPCSDAMRSSATRVSFNEVAYLLEGSEVTATALNHSSRSVRQASNQLQTSNRRNSLSPHLSSLRSDDGRNRASRRESHAGSMTDMHGLPLFQLPRHQQSVDGEYLSIQSVAVHRSPLPVEVNPSPPHIVVTTLRVDGTAGPQRKQSDDVMEVLKNFREEIQRSASKASSSDAAPRYLAPRDNSSGEGGSQRDDFEMVTPTVSMDAGQCAQVDSTLADEHRVTSREATINGPSAAGHQTIEVCSITVVNRDQISFDVSNSFEERTNDEGRIPQYVLRPHPTRGKAVP